MLNRSEVVLSSKQASPRLVSGSGAKASDKAPESMRLALKDQVSSGAVWGEDELPGKINYLIGSDPTKWRTGIATYARVQYAHVYPGIDLVYYGTQLQLEFDFDVAPGADPRKIEMQFCRTDDESSGEHTGICEFSREAEQYWLSARVFNVPGYGEFLASACR